MRSLEFFRGGKHTGAVRSEHGHLQPYRTVFENKTAKRFGVGSQKLEVRVVMKTAYAGHFTASLGYLLLKFDARKELNSCRYIWSSRHFSQNFYNKKSVILLITNRPAKFDSRHYVKTANWHLGSQGKTEPKREHLREELRVSDRHSGKTFGKTTFTTPQGKRSKLHVVFLTNHLKRNNCSFFQDLRNPSI